MSNFPRLSVIPTWAIRIASALANVILWVGYNCCANPFNILLCSLYVFPFLLGTRSIFCHVWGVMSSNEISLEDTINFDSEGNELKFEDIFGTEEDVVEKELENKEDQKLMINEILKLNERDKIIIEKRYGLFGNEELTQKEIANKMSISQSYISRIEKKVVKKLKTLLKI